MLGHNKNNYLLSKGNYALLMIDGISYDAEECGRYNKRTSIAEEI